MSISRGCKDFDNVGCTARPILLRVPCDPSSLQLFDVLRRPVHAIPNWNVEVGEATVVLLVALWDGVECFFILENLVLKVLDLLFVATTLLCVIDVALLEGNGEAASNGTEGGRVHVLVPIQEGECGMRRDRQGEVDGVEGFVTKLLRWGNW
jgi:hypothetical protein